ncbi:hypothetical protein A2U01_0017265, partial [Trifolium medium]|nr:hypothetical protein [Trifolium medium]
AQNPTKKTPQVAFPRLLSELFYQCAVVKRIQEAKAYDLLEEQRASFINGHTLSNMRLLKEAIKTPNQPLLIKKVQAPISEEPPMVYSDEPKEVILEYMRLLKEQGKIITGADIGGASSEGKQTKRKRSVKVKLEKVDEEKTSDKTSTSGAGASEAKPTEEKKTPEGTTTEDIGASEAKESDKGKAVEATTSEEKSATEKKEKDFKKPRSVKKIAPKIPRKYVVLESDEEIEEEQPLTKRKKSEQSNPEKDQSPAENMDTEANTGNLNSINGNVADLQAQTPPISSPLNQPNTETNDNIDPALLQPLNIIHPPKMSDLPPINSETNIETLTEGFKLATEIHKNKSHELTSLLHQLKETNPQTQSQQSSPLQILEQHLE